MDAAMTTKEPCIFAHMRDAFRRIEAEAREQVTAELIAEEHRPLVYGEFVAWAEYGRMGHTDDLSEVHRVGHPVKGQDMTTCSEKIPAATRRLPLGPGLLSSLRHCKFCEMMLEREKAA